jgi:hypothetical protein
LYWAVHYSLTDDSYITLTYARNLAFHGTWGMTPNQAGNAATSPLNVLLIGFFTLVTRRPLLALGFVFVGSSMLIAWTTARVARRLRVPVISALLVVALLLLNPFFLSSTGLEPVLVAGLMSALLCCAVEERPGWFGVVAGFSLLARLDMVLFVIPLLLSRRVLRRGIGWVALGTLGVSLPWFLPRWLVSGSAIPDTFVVKTLQSKLFGPWTFVNGWRLYLDMTHSKARVSFLPVVVAGGVLSLWLAFLLFRDRFVRKRFRPVIALAVGGGAYFAAYSAMQVPPYHWYYSPLIAAASIILGLTLASVARLVRGSAAHGALALVVLVAPMLGLTGAEAVVVAHHGLPWTQEPIVYTNWADRAYYAYMGRQLRDRVGDKLVVSPGEIGTLAFYCDCNLVDVFSDERFAMPLINERIAKAGPVMRWLLKENYRYLDLTVGPPRVDYRIVWEPGWVYNDPNAWNAWSSLRGFGHFRLLPA